MQDELRKAWDKRATLPLASSYEALILASIVEKETALERERSQIAGVFVERLRRGMRLQTDPTVIYGMGARYDGNIRRADCRATPAQHVHAPRLPPTPIAMPGLESLQAAVQPDVSGALFFVATGVGDGSHYFSKTLAEHNLAVRRYPRSCVADESRKIHHHRRQRRRRQDDADRCVARRAGRARAGRLSRASLAVRRARRPFASCSPDR